MLNVVNKFLIYNGYNNKISELIIIKNYNLLIYNIVKISENS